MNKYIARTSTVIFMGTLFFAVLFPQALASEKSEEVHLSLFAGKNTPAKEGDIVPVFVIIWAHKEQAVDAVQILLDYNPAEAKVVDLEGEEADSILPGPILFRGIWQDLLLNQVSPKEGEIRFAAGKGLQGSKMQRPFIAAVIPFQIQQIPDDGTFDIAFKTKVPLGTLVVWKGYDVTGKLFDLALPVR